MKKAFEILSISSILFVLIRVILFVIYRSNANTLMFIYYDVSNDVFWYSLFYFIPIILSILLALLIKRKQTFIKVGQIFIFLLLAITISGSIANKKYWGYYFKRPSIFNEVKNANELLSITEFEKTKAGYKKVEDTTLLINNKIVTDFYYFNYERPIFAMLSEGNSVGNLIDWKEIYKSPKTKISDIELNKIETLLSKSKFIDSPEKGYEKHNITKGIVIEFVTNNDRKTTLVSVSDNRTPRLSYDRKYFYVIVSSGQISNDHYGNFEFLIENNKVIKKNKFYHDLAGIEGMEYPIAAPLLEFLALLITLILFLIIKTITKKLRK